MNRLANSDQQKKNKLKMYIPLTIVIVSVLVFMWMWYRNYSRYISTDDAYIESDNVAVSSKILGRIINEFADEGDSVKKGTLLAILDSSDLYAQENQAIAMMNQAITTKSQTEATYNYDQEGLKILKVNLDKAKEDFDRAKIQFDGKIITKESFDHSSKAYEAATAQYNTAVSSLAVSRAKIESAGASIKSAAAQVALIQTQLKNTRLYAPMDGIIAKRWLLPGDIVTSGQSVFTITNNEKFWVIVYLEETRIAKVYVGQNALFSIDAFPGKEFFGKVFSIGSYTASQFSLIPPNNASGNFTKVTQRVPVKISIEGIKKDEKLNAYKFLVGMSAEVKIEKK